MEELGEGGRQPEKVSIPSRRVGDSSYAVRSAVVDAGFHPLKAGRRREVHLRRVRIARWFPSPQGGSETARISPPAPVPYRFPSPQGGSETSMSLKSSKPWTKFPSPQGGSETITTSIVTTTGGEFPSPQGGSETQPSDLAIPHLSEFPSPQGGSETKWRTRRSEVHLRVSIPSRRVGDVWATGSEVRLSEFPSPQGGSETVT